MQRSLYTYRYEDCIGMRLNKFTIDGLRVNNIINKHKNKAVDAEGTYLKYNNCGYEYDSRGFTKNKYDWILKKTDRKGSNVINKYEKIIFIASYFALDKKGEKWKQIIDYNNHIFFRYRLDFQVFEDFNNLFNIKKKNKSLLKYL